MHIKYLVPILIFILSGSTSLVGQEFDPYIQEKVDQLSYDSMYLRLQQFEDLGIKNVGSTNLDATGEWIIDFYQQNGYTNIETDSLFVGPNQVYNIIITKTGTVYPDTYLIVDGHYDTYNGPGVNDNGSGTAIVMEVARLMKDVETEYSIKFIHFTAEEVGLIGSSHYVENTVIPENMDIRLVFNIDEVGGVAGEVNNTITCERDEWAPNQNNASSAAFTDTLANITEMYSSLNTWINYAYGTDYIPFMQNGYVITGFYEFNESPYPHTINDSLSNLDPEYVFEVTKASLAASLYFGRISNTVSQINELINSNESISIDPNPFVDEFTIQNLSDDTVVFSLYNINGMVVFQDLIKQSEAITINPKLSQGFYLYTTTNHKGQITSGGKLIKK